jgi:outer membrane lipoprotein-sorting protein
MNFPRLALFAAASLLLSSLALADAPSDEWIIKARAYLGPEDALNSVTSLHITGVIENERKEQIRAEFVFQKPDQHFYTLSDGKTAQTTALDDYDGWVRRQDLANPAAWQLTILEIEQVRRMRANNAETLGFYRSVGKRGGRTEFQGDTRADGVDCVKIAFIYSPTLIFYRYFEKATGRLVMMQTETGLITREVGETIVNGIRFGQKLTNASPNGVSSTLTIEKITLNEKFPAGLFAVPTVTVK